VINQREGKLLSDEEIAADNARIAAKLAAMEPEPPRPSRHAPPRTFKRIADYIPAVTTDGAPEPAPYRCPKCGGAGFFTPPVAPDHPLFGKAQRCDQPNCPHVQRDRQKRTVTFFERMARHFGTKAEHYEQARLADLDNPQLQHNPVAVQAARLFLSREPMVLDGIEKHSLVFSSKMPGTGKTYIASIIHNELCRRQELSWFNSVRSMLRAVQDGYGDDALMRSSEVEDALCNAPFLFIDELEINRASGDKIDILESVINTRMLAKMPTVITTNLTQKSVGDVWNFRIQSRLEHVAWWIDMGNQTLRNTGGVISGKG